MLRAKLQDVRKVIGMVPASTQGGTKSGKRLRGLPFVCIVEECFSSQSSGTSEGLLVPPDRL